MQDNSYACYHGNIRDVETNKVRSDQRHTFSTCDFSLERQPYTTLGRVELKRFSLATVVALSIGAFAWACSEELSTPTGTLDVEQPSFHHSPDHGKGGGGNDGGSGGGDGGGDDGGSTTAALTNAMATSDPAAHPVNGKENKRSLDYSTDQNASTGSATLTVNFAGAAATYQAGGCYTNQKGADATDLATQLTTTATGATVAVKFDKTADGSVSTGHGATAVFGDYRIGLPPHRNPMGTIVSDDGTTIVMEFTGGDVRVWRISDDLRLFCPNGVGEDAVTVTVVR